MLWFVVIKVLPVARAPPLPVVVVAGERIERLLSAGSAICIGCNIVTLL
jgi:hypothetical protein